MSKSYTRDQKIAYYTDKIAYYRYLLRRAEARLTYIQSDQYQDWSSDLQKELNRKRASKKKAAS
jgi:DNA-binding transcriptional regulator YbjK